MVSPAPTFQTLISVEEFRALVQENFEREINEGQLYDSRDIQRFNEIDEYALMFVQHGQLGTTFDETRALRVFNASMIWRRANRVYDISTEEFPVNYFDRNGIYFKNHDINNHPILHFVVRTFTKGQEDNESVKRFITYHLERHVRRNPGQKIVLLFDLSSAGIKNLDYDIVKFIISCTQTNYPGLLAYMLNFKMPLILTAAWKVIRAWLPPEADQFVKFVDAKTILDFIPPNQLSPAMGGTDTTTYVHVHNPINDAVEDPMNASLKKKVTFADAGLTESTCSPSPTDPITITDHASRHESSFHDDPSTPEDTNHSLSTSDSSQTVTRKSILQKSTLVNGSMGEEKVYHGLGIKPYDEMIFERIDSPQHGTADCIQTLTLTNVGDKILTFKIKTTSPDKFRVKPGCSLLHPGATATISVYLLKAYCTPTCNINKEKFLIIWTLLGHELKQTQLVEFWKNVSSTVLYEHRLKCSFSNKTTSAPPVHQSNEISTTPRLPMLPDPSLTEMRDLLNDSMKLQQTTIAKTSKELENIRYLLLIIFAFLFLILLWDIYKYFISLSSSTSSVKSDL